MVNPDKNRGAFGRGMAPWVHFEEIVLEVQVVHPNAYLLDHRCRTYQDGTVVLPDRDRQPPKVPGETSCGVDKRGAGCEEDNYECEDGKVGLEAEADLNSVAAFRDHLHHPMRHHCRPLDVDFFPSFHGQTLHLC